MRLLLVGVLGLVVLLGGIGLLGLIRQAVHYPAALGGKPRTRMHGWSSRVARAGSRCLASRRAGPLRKAVRSPCLGRPIRRQIASPKLPRVCPAPLLRAFRRPADASGWRPWQRRRWVEWPGRPLSPASAASRADPFLCEWACIGGRVFDTLTFRGIRIWLWLLRVGCEPDPSLFWEGMMTRHRLVRCQAATLLSQVSRRHTGYRHGEPVAPSGRDKLGSDLDASAGRWRLGSAAAACLGRWRVGGCALRATAGWIAGWRSNRAPTECWPIRASRRHRAPAGRCRLVECLGSRSRRGPPTSWRCWLAAPNQPPDQTNGVILIRPGRQATAQTTILCSNQPVGAAVIKRRQLRSLSRRSLDRPASPADEDAWRTQPFAVWSDSPACWVTAG